MNDLFDIHVSLRGGIQDLTKALGVLALLSLTPRNLSCEQKDNGLEVHMRLAAPANLVDLLAARLGNFIQIATVTVAAVEPCSGSSA